MDTNQEVNLPQETHSNPIPEALPTNTTEEQQPQPQEEVKITITEEKPYDINEFNHIFSEVQENAVDFNIEADSYQLNQKSIGVVVYGSKDFYSDEEEENESRHLPYKEHFHGIIKYVFEKKYKTPEIVQVVSGHEHGGKKKKCHFQIFIEFEKPARNRIKPFAFVIEGFQFLGMVQKAKNKLKLINYCQKDKDFTALHPEKLIKTVSDGKKVDAFKTIWQNKEKFESKQEALDLAFHLDTKTSMLQFSNIQKSIDYIIKPILPPFKWQFPDRLKEKHPKIYSWFLSNCLHAPYEFHRKKALVLYSAERAMGKTTFAKELVPHEDYYIIFRNTFTAEQIQKKKEAKLLIMDDMTPYTSQTKETWKALFSGEKTSIRDAYLNTEFNFNIPCILTTNNKNLFLNLMAEDEFKYQATFVQVQDYLGPEGSEPVRFRTFEAEISDEMRESLLEKKRIRESYPEDEKKRAFLNAFNNFYKK